MEENTENQNVQEQQVAPPVQEQGASPPPQETSSSSGQYASFWERLGATLIDGLIVGVVTGILGRLLGMSAVNRNPTQLLGVVYAVFMLNKYGATLGKMALGIKVQDEETGANLSIGKAIFRELGKFISVIAIFIGYLWMLWDDKKQTWHDKFAKSTVVKSK